MLNGILNNCTPRELREKEDGVKAMVELLQTAEKEEKEKLERKIHLKNKIRQIGKMSKILKQVRLDS
jgi:hypothetical protein